MDAGIRRPRFDAQVHFRKQLRTSTSNAILVIISQESPKILFLFAIGP